MMVEICDLIDDWADLTEGVSKNEIVNSCSADTAKIYLIGINCLPLIWEDTVSSIMEYVDIIHLVGSNLKHIDLPIVENNEGVLGECFVYALKQYFRFILMGRDPVLYLGYSGLDEGVVSRDWCLHAWVVLEGTIFEPTPMPRDFYYGSPLNTDQAYQLMGWILADEDEHLPDQMHNTEKACQRFKERIDPVFDRSEVTRILQKERTNLIVE